MNDSCDSKTGGEETSPARLRDTRSSPGKRRALACLKVLTAAIVLCALGWHVRTLLREWSDQGPALAGLRVKGAWFLVAATAYVGGQACFGLFWARLLKTLGVRAPGLEMLRAYNIGTLGKYAPGKALVVLTRTGLIRGQCVSRLWVGFATVYETLASMAVGAALGAACLAVVRPAEWVFWLSALLVALGLITAIHPAVFAFLARLIALPFKESNSALASLGGMFGLGGRMIDLWRACHRATLRRWFLLPLAGWAISGLSFWAVAYGMGLDCMSARVWLLLTGTASLATVAGFLVLFMPAGIGVRELVIIHLLGPHFGASQVVLASLLLRTIWTAAELFFAGFLYVFPLLTHLRTALPGVHKMQNSASTSLSDNLHSR